MGTLNKLSFYATKVNEQAIKIPMELIKQEFDTKDYCKMYLFRVLYISKQQKNGDFTMYLGPLENSRLPVVKATIPFEIIRTSKIIPGFNYDRVLTEQERYIVDERIYREVNKVNLRQKPCYILLYGYLINRYKNDNALTQIKEGVQELGLSTCTFKRFKGRGFETTCFCTYKWDNICKMLQKEGMSVKKFKRLPKDFFEY